MPATTAAGSLSFAHEIGRAVDVGEDRFEQARALDQAGLQLLPFGPVDQERHVAQRPRPHRARGVLIDAIEHAGVAKVPVGRGKAAIDLLGSERREHAQKRPPVLAHLAVVVHHLVEDARKQAVIARQKRSEIGALLSGAVRLGHADHQI